MNNIDILYSTAFDSLSHAFPGEINTTYLSIEKMLLNRPLVNFTNKYFLKFGWAFELKVTP